MKCLLERLSTCKLDDVLWLSDPIGQIDISRLIKAFDYIDPTSWQGKRVGIGVLSSIEFVSALVFLDGLAQAIVLLPAEDDISTREARLKQAEIDIVLEGDGFGFTKLLAQTDTSSSLGIVHPIVKNNSSAIQTTWLLPTSGTTGIPKLIPHTFTTLTRSMTTRRIGDDYIWGSLYSLRRFAGLQVFLQSWMCNTPFILNEEGANLSDVIVRLINSGCNALSATPSMWRKLAMHPLFNQLTLKQITLGGEIVDQSVLDMLTKKFPAARITHIYASTEAGVGFAVRDGRAGFPISYLRHPPLGVSMHIDDQNHLWFGSSENQPWTTETDSRWIDSGDVVETKIDRVIFLGRANGSINVGGNKVMPEEIESVIKELPEVAFVQVRARKSTILGNLVEAAIIPISGINIDASFKKKVITHCRSRLDTFKVPAFIVSTDEIELTASGKLSRINVK
ncbi:acyl--CoA ligase [Escherichia coli]|nr:acyl--CoA ligase [Escherichia coli]